MNFLENLKFDFIKFFKKGDWVIFFCFFTLMIFGLVTMAPFDSDNSIFWRQLLLIGISVFFFFIFSFMDMRFLKNSYLVITLYIFLISFLSFIFVFGHIAKGGARWFNLGSFFFGPSEPMKLVLIILFAKFFSKRHLDIANIKNIIISLIYMLIPTMLVMLQPDLSTGIILTMIWFGMILVSGLSKKHMAVFFITGFVLAVLGWNFFLHDYQKNRVLNFINPGNDIRGSGWNAYQSIVAVGSGGIFGKGVGYGTQSRLGFLPEHETDFIFASFLEEWGMFGGILVFILFLIIIFNLSQKSLKANSNFEALFMIGVSVWLIVQTSMNIGMNIGLVPVTGVPLPFMSHGGSHLIFESIALGMCVGMSRYGRVAHLSKLKNEFLGLE
ncbi:MAG: rod shape-determining protein RodA [Aliarcobacter sp.]|nr:rod shape-determining protein RodA [Aliarcobacter sp.]MBP9766105.1 rod shape-determining protein RodA [Candidatus Paceibacterota bacterium]